MTSSELRGFSREAIARGKVFRSGILLLLLICALVAFAAVAWGAIPTTESDTLRNIYTSTNGPGWTNSTNWNGQAGTECTWYGVTCDAGASHVLYITLAGNNLSGTLPGLGALTNLQTFVVGSNQLTGSIPSLSGLSNLQVFYASYNQLTGSIPSLSGLSNLMSFGVSDNQLTGSIPSLGGLTNLQSFDVTFNQLTGTIPPLGDLTSLQYFQVGHNRLSGDVPAVPSPNNNLASGGSVLCPNYLTHIIDEDWDAATAITPWYRDCTTYSVTYEGNGETGGSVPADGNAYLTDQIVTVLGNTGALYKAGDSFVGWNTAANGSGASYVAGAMFQIGQANVVLYAQWTTASGLLPVRIAETLAPYPDIQTAYGVVQNGQTIQAQDGLGSQTPLLFNNPDNVSFRLIGGYNATDSPFKTKAGATLVIGSIEVRRGTVVIENIIIQ